MSSENKFTRSDGRINLPTMQRSRRARAFAAFGIIALMIGMGALAWVPVGSASSPWVLTNNTTDLPGGANYNMINGGSISADITLTTGGLIWASEPATVNGLNMAGDWAIHLDYPALSLGVESVLVEIGVLASGTPTSKGTGTVTSNPGASDGDGTITTSGFIVNVGERIYVKLTRVDDSSGLTPAPVLDNTAASTATKPGTAPDYPVPELSTIILTTSGLVVGVGMLAYSNKKKKK